MKAPGTPEPAASEILLSVEGVSLAFGGVRGVGGAAIEKVCSTLGAGS